MGRLRKKDDFPTQVSYKVPIPVIEEENYDLQDDSSVIQYEMNMIELPMFSRDDKLKPSVAKKYIFSPNQYVEVTPSSRKESGFKIPQEFDEKIFYAIMQLYRKNNRRKIITTIYELLKLAGIEIGKDTYDRAKESIARLRDTAYTFSNILYNKEKNKRITETVTKSILQEARIAELEDLTKEELSYIDRETIKNAVIITITDFIEENILNKGFLYYDADKLLEIKNATARKIYLLTTKWRGWEKSDIIKRSCRFMASRVPLSWERTNIPGTVNSIEKAVSELKERGLVGDFIVDRKKPLGDSELIIFFDGAVETARLMKIEKENKLLAVETGHESLVISTVEDKQMTLHDVAKHSENKKEKTEKSVDRLISMLPPAEKTTMIMQIVEKYHYEKGYEYTESNIGYAVKNARENFSAFLLMSFINDYGQKDRLEKEYEQCKKWFAGLNEDKKAVTYKNFQTSTGIDKKSTELTETEKNVWRSYLAGLFKEI